MGAMMKEFTTFLIDIMGVALVFFAVGETVVRAALGAATVSRELWKKFVDSNESK